MTELDILDFMDRLIDVVSEETFFLKNYNFKKALSLLEKKEFLHLKHLDVKSNLKHKKAGEFSPYFIEHLQKKNNLLKSVAKENVDTLEMVIAANTRIINSVMDKLNENNRPQMMYSAKARKLNLNKYMPPAMALNEQF